jgi:hypothetical protein
MVARLRSTLSALSAAAVVLAAAVTIWWVMLAAPAAVAVLYPALAVQGHPAKVTTAVQVAQAIWLAVEAAALALLVALRRVLMVALEVMVQHLA